MAKNTIMVVDDEPDIRQLVKFNLEKEGFDVVSVADGESALEEVRNHYPDLIILDVMLPGIDGIEVCFKLKSDPAFKAIPIVMLSAKSDESDQLVGLKIGADDYLVKPFSPKVLVAKISAIIRRSETVTSVSKHDEPVIRHKSLLMDPNNFTVTYEDEVLKLTAVEYKILYLLALKPGRVYTTERILEQVRGDDVIITGRTVDVHILSLRRKLGDSADLIETVRGIGYRVRE